VLLRCFAYPKLAFSQVNAFPFRNSSPLSSTKTAAQDDNLETGPLRQYPRIQPGYEAVPLPSFGWSVNNIMSEAAAPSGVHR